MMLPPSSAEVKNAWSYTSIPPIHLHGVVLSTGTTLPFTFSHFWMGRGSGATKSGKEESLKDFVTDVISEVCYMIFRC
jgi:hypothetical protein